MTAHYTTQPSDDDLPDTLPALTPEQNKSHCSMGPSRLHRAGTVARPGLATLSKHAYFDDADRGLYASELLWQLIPRPSAPAESIAAFKVGDRVENLVAAECFTLTDKRHVKLRIGAVGTVVSIDDVLIRVMWDGIPKPDYHGGWGQEPRSLRPAPTPSTATSEPKAEDVARVAEPDAYARIRERHEYANEYGEAGNTRTRANRIAAMTASTNPLDRLAAKRAAVLVDLNTPSRTRRDRLGSRLGAFTDWISTRHAK